MPPERKNNPLGWIGFFEVGWFEVTADGFAPLWAEFQLSRLATPLPARDFTLLRGATIVGTVEDAETGKPVPGPTVSLYSREGMMGYGRAGQTGFQNPYAPRVLARLQGDESGKFRLEHVPCGATDAMSGGPMGGQMIGGVVAWAGGYTAAADQVVRPTDGATIEMTLKVWPAATITGRVLAVDGKPAPDVTVSAVVAGKEQKGFVPPIIEGVPRSWAKTGADGRYRLDGVPAAREGATAVLLKAFAPRGPRSWRSSPPEGDTNATVSVKAGEILEAGDLVLPAPEEPYPTTTVRVLLPGGRPCFGATVTRGEDMNAPRTDAEGNVAWNWAKPKEGQVFPPVDVVVRLRGFAPTAATLHPPGSGKELVEVTLLPAHRVTGSVVLADGTPGAGLPVCVADGALKVADVLPDVGNELLVRGRLGTRERSLPAVYAMVYAAEDGTFVVEDLPEGPYHVRATKARRVGGGVNAKPLAALASGVASGADLALRIPADDSPATGGVRVTVTDAGTGKAVPGVSVLVKRGTELIAHASSVGGRFPGVPGSAAPSDPTGTVTVPTVPVGTYSVEVSAAGFRPSRVENVEVRADATTVVPPLLLDRGVTVVGRVVPPHGLALKVDSLQFRELGAAGVPRIVNGAVAEDGTFRVTGFEPGRYRVVASAPPTSANTTEAIIPARGEDLVVGAGAEARFDVEWIAAGLLGVQPDDDRLPASRWNPEHAASTEEQKKFGAATRVTVRTSTGTTLLDVTGVRRQDAGDDAWLYLPPGLYTARIEFPGGESREESVDLKANAQSNVYFRKR